MRHKMFPLLLCVLLTAAGPVAAQAPTAGAAPVEAPSSRPVTLLLDMPDGSKPREYQTDEMSIAISRTMDGRGDSRGEVMITLGAVRPFDTALLQWARQGEAGSDASRRAVITIPASAGPVASAEARYELEGAKVIGFNASHSVGAATTQVMLQVAARRVTLNGIVMN